MYVLGLRQNVPLCTTSHRQVEGLCTVIHLPILFRNVPQQINFVIHHHHHVQEELGLIPVPCILKMKLVPPSLPRSPYVSSSFWFIL